MQNKVVERIWFEVKNLPPSFHGYDGMEGLENSYNVDHSNEEGYVKVSDVLAIIERHLTQRTADVKPESPRKNKSRKASRG